MERQLTQVGACFHEKSGFKGLHGYAVPCGEPQQRTSPDLSRGDQRAPATSGFDQPWLER
jgi:hypothetical protein